MLKSIRDKILLSELGLLFLISLSIGSASYFLTVRYQKKVQKEKLELILKDEIKFFQMTVDGKAKLIENMAQSNELKIYSVRSVEPLIINYFVLFEKDFPSLAYVNKNGMEEVKVLEKARSWNLKDLSGSDYFKNVARNRNKAVLSHPRYSEDLKMPVIEFAVSNYEYFGDELNFVLSGSVPVHDITKNISDLRIGETGFALLIDKEGKILSLSSRQDILTKIPSRGKKEDNFIEKVKAFQSGFERAEIMGKDCMVAYSPVGDMEWALMIVVPYEEFMSLPYTLRNVITLMSVLIFTAGGLISLFLSYNITKPIKQLVLITFDVATGNFSKRADIISRDEIGLLSKSFNIMTENLEKTTVSKNYFDSIIKNMSDILIVTDKNLKIETVNKAGMELLGYDAEEIKEKQLFDLIEANESSGSVNSAIITNDEFKNFEITLRRKGKKGIPSLFSIAAVKDKDGKTKNFICTAKDISERKKAEDDLREYTKKIEYINKELDSYSYIVSHDLKEPLRSINAFSRFIIDDYNDKLDEFGRKYLERIQSNAARIQKIVEDFIEISNIEKCKNPFEEVKVENILNEVNSRLEKEITRKNARIIIKNKMPAIFCDYARFTSVFVNLVSNAIKFADKDPPVIEIGYNDNGEYFEFYVKDNGPGIEEQYHEKIFRLFQRLVKREEYEGIGVGLTIVKKVIEMHKGKIRVESRIGEGSTFYFTIPSKISINSKENFGSLVL